MSITVLAWLAVGAYALHILEEHILGWHGWARRTININMEWSAYTTIETVLLILGAVAAMLVSQMPVLALAFIAFLLINVTFFHLLPMIIAGGKFSPGVISGILLFYPIGYQAFMSVARPTDTVVWAVIIGAAIILWPMLLLRLRTQRYFTGASSGGSSRSARKRAPARRRRR
jgi:hypothetical protein